MKLINENEKKTNNVIQSYKAVKAHKKQQIYTQINIESLCIWIFQRQAK